jgi:hypothetical protein
MSCPNITIISSSEFIGNSLPTINANFLNLKDGICDNETQITNIQSFLQSLQTTLFSLSSNAVNGVAKNWVKFSGNKDSFNFISTNNPDRFIFNSLGISSVYRKNIGDYRIYFQTPMQTKNYCVVVSNKETVAAGKYVWSQIYKQEIEYADIKVVNSEGDFADPDFVSVIIYA